MRATFAILCVTTLLGGCGLGDPTLHDLESTGGGPDEFSVLPTNPLEIPPLAVLPQPTPGGTNRTDRNPIAEGIVALGGNPAAAYAGGVPSSDAALVAAAQGNGVDPSIRTTLASEDARFRRMRSGITSGLFGGDPYYRAYSGQSLDAYAELGRFRQSGVPTPTAPPQAR
ncbi:DUF3035 domain-containing protein [Pelagovum pacificum]|uniref:DUF3035 domain-containing protein n=1 Tax=Pelagovum pacificum TaxID=2588711 RepID=A0A5C5GHL7_9RHOB|nr:DUF3035 domain-containing protein [Pelagovum pacificum]QQA43132.1 DUF3035 domain-containing protein [Pelagovum pacificum]TNY33724.1 DUF3035 domain-containing protein [Pelagovum pacificum]